MIEKPKAGRTPWDALVEILSTWRLLFLIFGTVLVLFLTVHISAEPGSSVEFFGVLKYQKAKVVAAAPIAPSPDETTTYLFPKSQELLPDSSEAIPILDGTLAVRTRRNSVAELIGDSIGKIRVGSRRTDGTPTQVTREGTTSVSFWENTRLEIEYRGRMFAVDARARRQGVGILISAETIPRATLNLRLVKDLPLPNVEN